MKAVRHHWKLAYPGQKPESADLISQSSRSGDGEVADGLPYPPPVAGLLSQS